MKFSKEIKIALITLLAIAAFIAGINFLKGRRMFSSQKTYYVVYPHANGLTSSTSVMLNGMKIGSVENLQFISPQDTRILARIVLTERLDIPKNSVAAITTADILGTKIISLQFSDEKEMYKNKDTLIGFIQADMLSEVSSQLSPIKDKFEQLTNSIDTLISGLNAILNIETQNQIQRSISDLSATLYQMKLLGQKTNSIFDQQTENVNQLIENFSKISNDLNKANLAQVVESLKTTLSQTEDIMKKINQSEGSMGELINNKKLYDDLTKSAESLNSLLEDIQKNPKRYIHFSVFGGKNK